MESNWCHYFSSKYLQISVAYNITMFLILSGNLIVNNSIDHSMINMVPGFYILNI